MDPFKCRFSDVIVLILFTGDACLLQSQSQEDACKLPEDLVSCVITTIVTKHYLTEGLGVLSKHCSPRSDCSIRSSLISDYTVCILPAYFWDSEVH